jgi:hypothetical protein
MLFSMHNLSWGKTGKTKKKTKKVKIIFKTSVAREFKITAILLPKHKAY